MGSSVVAYITHPCKFFVISGVKNSTCRLFLLTMAVLLPLHPPLAWLPVSYFSWPGHYFNKQPALRE